MSMNFAEPEKALQIINNEQILDTIRRAEPQISIDRLNNGMRLVSVEQHNLVTLSSVVVYFDAGSRRESPEHQGKMHFFEHLPPGAFRLANDGVDILDLSQRNGWELQISTNKDCVRFGFKCCDFDIHNATATLIKLLEGSEALYREIFPLEKGRILDEIDKSLMSSNTLMIDTINSVLTGESGYGHSIIGNRKQVERYGFEDVINFGGPFFNPRNATLAATASPGDMRQITAAFENLNLSPVSPFSDLPQVNTTSRWGEIEPVTHVASSLVSGITVMGLLPGASRGFSREAAIVTAVNDILSPVLFRELSAKSGLTYSAESFEYVYPGSGSLISMFGMAPKNVGPATEIFLKIIDSLSNYVTEESLAAHRQKTRNNIYSEIAKADPTSRLGLIASLPQDKIPSHYERLRMISSITVDDLHACIRDTLTVGQLKFIVFGSSDALKQLPATLNV